MNLSVIRVELCLPCSQACRTFLAPLNNCQRNLTVTTCFVRLPRLLNKDDGLVPSWKKKVVYGLFLHDEVKLCQPLPIIYSHSVQAPPKNCVSLASVTTANSWITLTMMIQGLNKLPRPWMGLLSKSRVNIYVADYTLQRWPHQHSPTHMFFSRWVRHRHSSIKQWDYIPLPLNQMGHCNSLNQKNVAEATLHNFRGEINSQDGICPVCTPSWSWLVTWEPAATLWSWRDHTERPHKGMTSCSQPQLCWSSQPRCQTREWANKSGDSSPSPQVTLDDAGESRNKASLMSPAHTADPWVK